ncbi:MAG: hypothetical protein ACI4NB_10705 [Candidatus Ornithospirochaeta sp.]
MKKLIAIILINFSLFLCFSVTTETASFTVRAYKVGSQEDSYLNMGVYDALTGTLQTVDSSYNKIDLTPYTNNLKSNSIGTSSSVEPYDKHVIFSFRVSGNYNGSFKCTVDIGAFELQTDKTKTITAYYEMRDVSCVFLTNYSTTITKGGKTQIDAKTENVTVPSSGTITPISVTWTVKELTELENWRLQGSVGMAIEKDKYSSAANGVYKASVTITLEVV